MSRNHLHSWILAVLALWGIPSFLFWSGIGIGRNIWYDARVAEAERFLDRALSTAIEQGERAIERTLEAEFKRLEGKGSDLRSVEAAEAALVNRFPPGSLELFLADGAGRLVAVSPEASVHRYQRVFDFLSRSWWEAYPEHPGSFAEVASLISAPSRLARLRDQPGRLHLLGIDEPRSRYYVGGYFLRDEAAGKDRIGGLLAFVRLGLIGEAFRMGSIGEPREAGDVRLGFLSEKDGRGQPAQKDGTWLDLGDSWWKVPEGLSAQESRDLIDRYRLAASSRIVFGGFLVEGRSFHGRSQIFALTPLPSRGAGWLALLFVIYAAFSLRCQLWLYDVLVLQTVVRQPLKRKLGVLFLLGGVFPLTAAAAIGALYLRDKREEITIAHRQRAFARLEAIDAGFEAWVAQRERRYRGLVEKFGRDPGTAGLERLLVSCRELQDAIRLDDYFLISSAGAILAFDQHLVEPELRLLLRMPLEHRKRAFEAHLQGDTTNTTSEKVDCLAGRIPPEAMPHRIRQDHRDRLRRFMPKMALEVMRDSDRRRGLASLEPGKASDLLFDDAMGEDGRMAFNLMKFSLGKFGSNSMMGNAGYLFVDVLTDRRGEAQYFLLLAQNFICLQWEFLEPLFADDRRFTPEGEIRAIGWMRDLAPRYPLEQGDPYLHLRGELSKRGGERLVARVDVRGTERDVLVQKGKALLGFDLLISIPPEVIDHQLDPYLRQVVSFLFGTLLFSLLLGWMLLEKVLIPVQEIAAGVAALTRKEFTFRVRVSSEDELGFLCTILNRTIAHLSDMEVASIVQNMLYPREPLRAGRFVISGRNIMTQAIGGDYYDFFRLRNGTVVVILGDVSGHGFSAALVTAMAKAAFSILCPRFPDEPQKVLDRLNAHLLEILQKSKMMTCALVLLDPETGGATICNAGQSYPILVDGTGTPVLQELGSTPLGIRKSSRTVMKTVDLASASLVLYSDGLIEATEPNGEPVGYARFAGIVGASVEADPEASCRAVLQRVRAITDPVPWNDDATVLVISNSR